MEEAEIVVANYNLFQAAQHGHLNRIRELISSGQAGVNDRDKDNASALHWVAINEHLECAQYLISVGAEVDSIGGDLKSTPLHWAVRQGHEKMVHLLFRAGADPRLVDSQSFNGLHLAAQYGHVMCCIYLICQGVDVNSLDNDRRTPLMWAVYKNLSEETVETLIKFNSDLDRADNIGCTALHWAALVGNTSAIRLLIEAGAKTNLFDSKHMTAEECAVSKGHGRIYKRILSNRPGVAQLSKKTCHLILFILPFIGLGLMFAALCNLTWLLAVPLCAGGGYFASFLIEQLRGDEAVIGTPVFTGFFQASFFWSAVAYFTQVLSGTGQYTILNAFVLILIFVMEYFCYKSVFGDPGFIKQGTIDSAKPLVLELVDAGKLNSRHFCNVCLTRKPLRSKHDRTLNRCVAKFDHYCPWVNNAVGYGNQRSFVFYLTCACLVQAIYVFLAITYAVNNTSPTHVNSNAFCYLPFGWCAYFDAHPFALFTAAWCVINGTWESATLFSQYHVIWSNETTNESINGKRYDYMRAAPGGKNYFNRGFIRNCGEFCLDDGSPNKKTNSNLNYYELYDIPTRDSVSSSGKHV